MVEHPVQFSGRHLFIQSVSQLLTVCTVQYMVAVYTHYWHTQDTVKSINWRVCLYFHETTRWANDKKQTLEGKKHFINYMLCFPLLIVTTIISVSQHFTAETVQLKFIAKFIASQCSMIFWLHYDYYVNL